MAAALVLLFLLRTFVVQSFSVPSGSMQPTIEPGDRVLVFAPASRLVHSGSVHRGDVVVFDGTSAFASGPPVTSSPFVDVLDALASVLTLGTGTDYVKRVVGLPGDHVVCCDSSGRIVVNGTPVDETSYLAEGDRPSDVTFDVTVPRGSLWVMGDHRGDSSDSRSYLGRPGGGMVPLDDVIGQATVRYWPPGRLGSLGEPGPLALIPRSPGAGQ